MPVPNRNSRTSRRVTSTPAELLEDDQMYTVYEIARLLQGVEPDAELEPKPRTSCSTGRFRGS